MPTNECQDAVAVKVSVFIRNDIQKWTSSELPEWNRTVQSKGIEELVFAYEMFHTQVPSSQTGESSFRHVDVKYVNEARNILDCSSGDPISITYLPTAKTPVQPGPGGSTNPNAAKVSADSDRSGRADNANEPARSQRFGERSGLPGRAGNMEEHIDYFTHRNLEHILSVCAVPVEPRSQEREIPQGLSNLGVTPIALTCGDLSFHRVNTAASL